eukprot:TRINITY_DN4818_c2_g1_i1.p1 TRINITY_DN4818_c2_g1~~TRINITY_DN4818_c2_g1_i1.p1  ORF type:complete len:513 (-),score=110.04 TRINITY_DN4818_c2_g1_i1:741-2258(-)
MATNANLPQSMRSGNKLQAVMQPKALSMLSVAAKSRSFTSTKGSEPTRCKVTPRSILKVKVDKAGTPSVLLPRNTTKSVVFAEDCAEWNIVLDNQYWKTRMDNYQHRVLANGSPKQIRADNAVYEHGCTDAELQERFDLLGTECISLFGCSLNTHDSQRYPMPELELQNALDHMEKELARLRRNLGYCNGVVEHCDKLMRNLCALIDRDRRDRPLLRSGTPADCPRLWARARSRRLARSNALDYSTEFKRFTKSDMAPPKEDVVKQRKSYHFRHKFTNEDDNEFNDEEEEEEDSQDNLNDLDETELDDYIASADVTTMDQCMVAESSVTAEAETLQLSTCTESVESVVTDSDAMDAAALNAMHQAEVLELFAELDQIIEADQFIASQQTVVEVPVLFEQAVAIGALPMDVLPLATTEVLQTAAEQTCNASEGEHQYTEIEVNAHDAPPTVCYEEISVHAMPLTSTRASTRAATRASTMASISLAATRASLAASRASTRLASARLA